MKTKITLLTISVALLLTACGQVQCSPTETTSPPTPAVQEETRQPQPTPEPTTTGQSPAAASTSVQELSQEDELQPEATPQVTQTPEPVTEPAPAEDIPSVTVSAKTGYDEDSAPTPEGELESALAPEPAPEPAAPANRQAAIDEANAYAVTQYGVVTDNSLTLDNSAYPILCRSTVGCLAGNTGSQGAGHCGLYLSPTHDAGGRGQPYRCRIPLQCLHHRGRQQPPDLYPLRRLSGAKPASV